MSVTAHANGGLPRRLLWLTLAFLVVACGSETTPSVPAGDPRPSARRPVPPPDAPNVVLIVADDLGYADLGVMGSEIRTPRLDALAREGVLLTDFHVTPVCFATRAALLSGLDHHLAGFAAPGGFAADRNQRGHPAYAGRFPAGVRLLAEDLRDLGYRTYMTGKWDLGREPEAWPVARGFDHSWALLDGGASHFADGAGMIVFQRGAHYVEDATPVDPPPGFYSTTFYTDQMLRYLRERPRDERPFFAYVAYTAPHWPLQVPDEWLDRYAGTYDAGYEKLHARRLARQRELGLVPRNTLPQPLPPHVHSWRDLGAEARQAASRRMEIYAAMVELLDREVGRLLDGVRAEGNDRDTVVVFLSDNGPEGNDISRLPLNQWWLPLAFDDDAAALGREGSYAWLGPGWAIASATPWRLYKAYTTEGGQRVPAIVWHSRGGRAGRREAGLLTVRDLHATLREYAGLAPQARLSAGASFRARLDDPAAPAPNEGRAIAIELFGRPAVRRDRWKALRMAPPLGTGRWQLHDLDVDPGERVDLASVHPDVLAELVAAHAAYVREVGVVAPIRGEQGYADPSFDLSAAREPGHASR